MERRRGRAVLVHGGRIWTGGGGGPFEGALLAEGGKFAAVGSAREVEDFAWSKSFGLEYVDAGGSLVIPGMTDAHIHLSAYCKQGLYLDLSGVSSIDEMLSRIKDYSAKNPDTHWLRGVGYNETMWGEHVVPTREMIDSVAGEHAVLISHYGGHTHVAGSRALEEAGMPADGKNASGLLRDSEAAPILQKVKEALESREYIKRALLEGCRKLTSFGITAVHACDVPSYGLPEHASLLHELHGERRLPLRVVSYHDELPNLDFSSGMGDRFVGYGGLKLFLDGTLGGWTAAMREDFSDKPGERGELLHTDEELSALLFEASRRGIQVQMHMIGDAATDQAVRVTRKLYERLGSRPGLPLRFNHVIVCPPGQLEELASLGVVVDVQPIQAHTDRFMAPLRLGSRRLGHSYSFRRLYDSGLLMTGSSDAPIEDPNPWLGIWSAVCRTDADGAPLKGFNPSETLTLDEALTIYTANPYKAIGWGDFGVIERGARADFVILAGDPFKGKPSDLRNVRVRSTYMDGVRMYG